jgi:uncharacterized NAD(P)/FAD-binding protein YdhS
VSLLVSEMRFCPNCHASKALVHLEVSRIVSCRGLISDPRRSSNPLVAQLLAEGYARIDPLGIGLDVDNDCAVVDARGRASNRIFAIGPMSQAAFWESIAVPDIRLQAASLARRLTSARWNAQRLDPAAAYRLALGPLAGASFSVRHVRVA